MAHPEPSASLFDAIARGDLDSTRQRLDAQPGLVLAKSSQPYWTHGEGTALQLACEYGQTAIARELITRGADVNQAATLGWTALHLSLQNREVAQLLLGAGADVDVHAASGLGDIERLRAFVGSDPASVHARGPDGATPLHFACTVPVAELLLDAGADIDAKDDDHGLTPVSWLARNRPVADLLRSRGAQIADAFVAAAVADVARLREFLARNPAAIHARTPAGDYYGEGATLLHLAARNGRDESVAILLERGADVNAIGGWFGVTPLHWAVEGGHADVVASLLRGGADPSIRDGAGHGTPRDWGHYFGHTHLLPLLTLPAADGS